MKSRYVSPKPDKITIRPDIHIAGLFSLKFVEGAHVRLIGNQFSANPGWFEQYPDERNRLLQNGVKPEDLLSQLAQINTLLNETVPGFYFDYLFPTVKQDPEAQFKEKMLLEQDAEEELADLGLYYLVRNDQIKDAMQLAAFMDSLNSFAVIEHVEPVVTSVWPSTSPTLDISNQQNYLNSAPVGIDARYAWGIPGGTGAQVKVIDVEYDWVTDHEDFPRNMFWGGRAGPYVREGSEHGTAVLGILAAPHNGFGIQGIAPDIQFGLSSVLSIGVFAAGIIATFSGENWAGRAHNVLTGAAIAFALSALDRGDILIIEQHTPGPASAMPCTDGNCEQWEFVAMEFYQECFDIIRRATARGVIVVEAAGNGGMDLDAPRYLNRFNRGVRDSGAILVGASSAGDLQPAGFTNFGSRVDVHGWGANVVSTGYGNGSAAPAPFNHREIPRFYTQSFGGTSSASPIVAGAAASIQSARRQSLAPVLTPREMRDLLVQTGTPQLPGSSGNIGPIPNLRAAIDRAVALRRELLSTQQAAALIFREGGIDKIYNFVVGNHEQLLIAFWDGFTWQWSNQGTPPGTSIAGGVAAAVYLANGIYACMPGRDGHLYTHYWDGAAWQWADQGTPGEGISVASDAAMVTYNNDLYIFVLGSDQHLHVNYWTGSAWLWADLNTPPAGGLFSRPSAVIQQALDEDHQRLHVFAMGNDGHLYSIFWDGAQWVWVDHETPPSVELVSAPAAVTYQSGLLNIFLIGKDGHLYMRYWDGAAWHWSDQSAPRGVDLYGTPAPVVSGTKVYTFVRGSDQRLYINFFNGAAWQWTSQDTPPGRPVSSDAGALLHPTGQIFAFVTTSDGFHFANHWDGRIWHWTYLGSPLLL